MPALKNLLGARFGRLVVVERAGYTVRGGGVKHVRWRCRCDCGNGCLVTGNNLRTGNTASCGCLARELIGTRSLKHGHAKRSAWTREYRAYRAMIDRCYLPSVRSFKTYGAKGIRVCDRWRHSFEAFLADMGPCQKGLTLDRRDPSGHYVPDNCRWATTLEQANNKLNNRFVTVDGQRMTVAQAAVKYGLVPWTLYRRLDAGFSVEDVIAGRRLPSRARTFTMNGVSKTREEWAGEYGLHPHTVQTRLWRGWTIEEALTHAPKKGHRPPR